MKAAAVMLNQKLGISIFEGLQMRSGRMNCMETMKLFQTLRDEKLLDTWTELLDWLVDDNRFDKKAGWSSGYVGVFTKMVKNFFLEYGAYYSYDTRKKLSFPEKPINSVTLLFAKGNGEARDLVRHIRNGITHGKTKLWKRNGEIYIQIKDYLSNSNEQTALFFFPLSCIMKVFECYKKIERKMMQADNKDTHIHAGKKKEKRLLA